MIERQPKQILRRMLACILTLVFVCGLLPSMIPIGIQTARAASNNSDLVYTCVVSNNLDPGHTRAADNNHDPDHTRAYTPNPDPEYNRAVAPEVAIFNAYTGTNENFYKSVLSSSDYNAVQAGYFGSLRYNTKVTGLSCYKWNSFANSNLAVLREDNSDLQINYSVTRKSNHHKHGASIYYYWMTSYCYTCLGYNTGGIATGGIAAYRGYDASQDTVRSGNMVYKNFSLINGSLDLAFNQSRINYHDDSHYCNCGGTAEGCMVGFYDGEAPTFASLFIKDSSGSTCTNFKPGDAVNIVLNCTEDIRFADDDPVGKGDIYIGLKRKGSPDKLYAHLTKLDGNQLVFTYQSDAADENIYDVVSIDLTAAPSNGTPLLSSTAKFTLKQLNVRNAFTATIPSGANELGITKSSSPITDMAGNPLIMESWMGDPSEIHRHFYIDGQKPFAVAADCSAVTNNADVKEALNKTDPTDPNYLDNSDLYLGVGDSLGLKVYMNEIVTYDRPTLTTNIKKGDGSYLTFQAYPAGRVDAAAANLGEQYGLGASDGKVSVLATSNETVTADMVVDNAEGKIQITGIVYDDMEDSAGNAAVDSTAVITPRQQYRLDTTAPSATVSDVNGANKTSYGFRVPFQTVDNTGGSGVSGMPGSLMLGGGTFTGKIKYAVTINADTPADEDWLDGAEGMALSFFQTGGQQYLHVKTIEGEAYDVSKLSFTLSDYAGNMAETTEVTVTGVGMDGVGPVVHAGTSTREYDNASNAGTLTANFMVSDISGVNLVQYQWNDGEELTEDSSGWLAAVGTLGGTSTEMTGTATVPSGEVFNKTLWVKAKDSVGNVSVTNLGPYTYSLAGIEYSLEYSTAVCASADLIVRHIAVDGVLVIDVQKQGDPTHYIHTCSSRTGTPDPVFYLGRDWLSADFDDSDGYKFTNLTYAGNDIFFQRADNNFTGNMTVTIYSGVRDSDITRPDSDWSGDSTTDITMTTNAKVETFQLRVAYEGGFCTFGELFTGWKTLFPQSLGKYPGGGPWIYNDDSGGTAISPYQKQYVLPSLEGQQISFDLGTDRFGWDFSDIDWENSYIEIEDDSTQEHTRLCGLGYGPVQTITLPASEAYRSGSHFIWIWLSRFSSSGKVYNNRQIFLDATEPGTLELGMLAKRDSNTNEYSEIPYDPSKTIYIPTQQCKVFLDVDVLDPDGTPHEMTKPSDSQNVGELSVIAWDVAHPENKVNLDRSYFVENNGTITESNVGTSTNSKRKLEFGIYSDSTSDNDHKLGLVPDEDNVVALQVRYANGRYTDVTYLTVHPVSIGMTGKASVVPDVRSGSSYPYARYRGLATFDPGSATVVFTPAEGSSTVGLTLYCQEGTSRTGYIGGLSPNASAYTPLPGTEPVEMALQSDGTYEMLIPTNDPGPLPEGLTETPRGFYFVYGVDSCGNKVDLGITDIAAICDDQPPTVPEKSLTAEDGMFTATYKISDASLYSYAESTNLYPQYTIDIERPMTLTLSLGGDYAETVGAAGQTLELTGVAPADGSDFTWKADTVNPLGIYEVTVTRHSGCYYSHIGELLPEDVTDEEKPAYLTVMVKGVVSPKADNTAMTLNLTAADAHGNIAAPVGASATVTGVQPQVIDRQYRQIDSASDDRALYLTFNMPVQPEESWINRSIQGYETEWHDAFPIWKDGEWDITFTDLFGTIYKQSLTLDNVIGEYGFELSFSTLDYVPAEEGVTITFSPDDAGETVNVNLTADSYTFTANGTYYVTRMRSDTRKDLLPIHLNNLVSGGPEETLFFYLDEFKEQYIAGSPEQFQGVTTGTVTVSYRTSRETSPEGETTVTIKDGEDDTFTFRYYDVPTNLTYTITGKLSDYGITLAAPPEPYADQEAPTIELVTIWRQHAGGYVQAEAFSGSADQTTIATAIERAGLAQSFNFVVTASDYSRWKLVVKSAEPTDMTYAAAESDDIPGVSVTGNNIIVDETVTDDFYIAVVDNAASDTAATSDNFTWIRIPFGSYPFDTVPPVIETYTETSGTYAKTVYIKATDLDNNGNPTTGVTVSGEGVVENTGTNAAEYPWMIVFEDNTSVLVTATDAAGNSSTATVQVTGIDMTAPVLSVSWSPCYYDPTTGVRDTGNPTLGPVNTDVTAHVTSSKPIARVEATYTDYYGDTRIYDFDDPDSNHDFWGSIEYNSQRISVRFMDSHDDFDVLVNLKVYAPNGTSTTIPLTLKRGVIDKMPPAVRVLFSPDEFYYGCGYLYREGYSVPYAASVALSPVLQGDSTFYCTNYGPVGEKYYLNTDPEVDDDYHFMYFTLYDDSEQTFFVVDKAGNQTTVVIPENPENTGYYPVYNTPTKEMLAIIDSVAPVLSVEVPENTSAENGAVPVIVTLSENCTLSADDSAVDCAGCTLTQEADGTWTGTVYVSSNGGFRLTATDFAGNQTSTTFTVNSVDKTLPIISFIPSTVSLRQDSEALELTALLENGVTAWDNAEIKAGTLHYDDSGVRLDVVGVYTVIYTVEDVSGNVGQAVRYVRIFDKNQPIVSVDGVLTEANGVVSVGVGDHILGVSGLKTPDEPYKLVLVKGFWTAGQMKRAPVSIPVGEDGSFTIDNPGFYTLYIVTQSRQTYLAVLYVES